MIGAQELIPVKDAHFPFGKNWQTFLRYVDEERIKQAQMSLRAFLQVSDLRGRTFVDVGCGSGLFSYAAFLLGATRIVSFDVDPLAVACCKWFFEKAGSPRCWEIHQGSVLVDQFISKLGVFDVVYAWGALHHTGDMRRAISNAAKLVNRGGYYYLTIYNKVEGLAGSAFWLKIKKKYNSSSAFGRFVLRMLFMTAYVGLSILKLRNPARQLRDHETTRGMHWRSDMSDWLGGYPYEYATVQEVLELMSAEHGDFGLRNLRVAKGIENNWYLFRRLGC